MGNEITLRLLGSEYLLVDYIVFLFFAFLGLGIIKNIRYKKRKLEHILAGNTPPWKWSFRKWLDENSIDALLTILISFAGLRFLGYWLKMIPLPEYFDIMVFGFLIGLTFQKLLHHIFQKVTVVKTIKKITT